MIFNLRVLKIPPVELILLYIGHPTRCFEFLSEFEFKELLELCNSTNSFCHGAVAEDLGAQTEAFRVVIIAHIVCYIAVNKKILIL